MDKVFTQELIKTLEARYRRLISLQEQVQDHQPSSPTHQGWSPTPENIREQINAIHATDSVIINALVYLLQNVEEKHAHDHLP